MSDMDNFVKLSAALTGIDPGKLAPGVDPINVKQELFDKAQTEGGAIFTQALGIAASTPAATLGGVLLNGSGEDMRFLCRSIMLLWLLGQWIAPGDLKRYALPNPPTAPIPSTVISSKAYTQGWIWKLAQAHPMGYSEWRFGYWKDPPPPLNAFIGP
jgi:hypothetical protein